MGSKPVDHTQVEKKKCTICTSNDQASNSIIKPCRGQPDRLGKKRESIALATEKTAQRRIQGRVHNVSLIKIVVFLLEDHLVRAR